MMRTTLNLDEDVATQLAAIAAQRGASLSRVANELMRVGLQRAVDRAAPEPYDPPTFDTGMPSLDVTDIAAALEVLDRAR